MLPAKAQECPPSDPRRSCCAQLQRIGGVAKRHHLAAGGGDSGAPRWSSAMSESVIQTGSEARTSAPDAQGHGHGHHHGSLIGLAVGAIGVVFGDIGTSPLYAMRDTFANEHHKLPLDVFHIYGIVSLMFWSMMIIVTLKYVTVIMRADNKGEGGSLALLALINQGVSGKRWSTGIVLLGVFATSLFYGDSMITPAV